MFTRGDRDIKNGLYRIVQKCSHCTDTLMSLDSVAILSVSVSVNAPLNLLNFVRTKGKWNFHQDKYAFQWDAYRPLVDCIPACTVCGGGVSQHALGRGVCIPACTGQGVCVYTSMHWAGRVSGWGGGCLPRGVSPWGCVCRGVWPPAPQDQRQTPPPMNGMTDRQV